MQFIHEQLRENDSYCLVFHSRATDLGRSSQSILFDEYKERLSEGGKFTDQYNLTLGAMRHLTLDVDYCVEAARMFQITTLPTWSFWRRGEEVARVEGVLTQEALSVINETMDAIEK